MEFLLFCLSLVPGNLGCYKDHGDPPPLTGTSKTSNRLTIQTCISFCRSQKFKVPAACVQLWGVMINQSSPRVRVGGRAGWGGGGGAQTACHVRMGRGSLCRPLSVTIRDVNDSIESSQGSGSLPWQLPCLTSSKCSFLLLLFFIWNPNH